jgi:hypothetical protein
VDAEQGPTALLKLSNALATALLAGLNAAIIGALKGIGTSFVEGLVGQPEFQAGGWAKDKLTAWGQDMGATAISGLTRGLIDGAADLAKRLGIVFASLIKGMKDIGK